MFHAIKTRIAQGSQYIKDVRHAQPRGFRGLPVLADKECAEGCKECVSACPTQAISLAPVRLDLGKCVFCGECESSCPSSIFSFSESVRMAAGSRGELIVSRASPELSPVRVNESIRRMFGRSLRLRSVSAGGCNGCELELNALTNVNFDIGRWGIDFVASPRHADALVLSGPITKNMAAPLRLAWEGLPAPKFVVAVGACAISGGLYAEAPALAREFLDEFQPSLFIPGCPPHPLTFINGVLDLLGIE